MRFEWDEAKNRNNIAKHGVDFELAQGIFEGPVFTWEDRRQDYKEKRFISIGFVEVVACLTVVHTERSGNTRIISARPASSREKRKYYDSL